MSSLVDAVIQTDSILHDKDADRDLSQRLNSDARSSPPRHFRSSSVRPRNGALQPSTPAHTDADDMEIDPDDEVVGAKGTTGRRPRGPLDPAVPKVVDTTAEKVRESFETFLEEYVRNTTIEFSARPVLLCIF